MNYKDFAEYLRRFTANNFDFYVGDKPLTEEMIEVDLKHNKLTLKI